MSKPYQQGSLDGLCGVYALVNAVDFLCGPLSSLQARTLFKQILLHLESKGSLAERCTEGIVINELAGILKFVVCKHYPIKRFKPFHQQPGVSQQRYLQTLSDFLKQPNTIVLLCLEGYYQHWTLIREITDTKLVAYDSSGIHYVLQSSCSMKNDRVERRHWLLPAQTYLLKKSR
jgi:hypothetical protein